MGGIGITGQAALSSLKGFIPKGYPPGLWVVAMKCSPDCPLMHPVGVPGLVSEGYDVFQNDLLGCEGFLVVRKTEAGEIVLLQGLSLGGGWWSLVPYNGLSGFVPLFVRVKTKHLFDILEAMANLHKACLWASKANWVEGRMKDRQEGDSLA